MIVNKSEFARRAGTNRSSITRAEQRGLIVVRPDGKLDTDNPVNQDYVRRSLKRKNKQSDKNSPISSDPESKSSDDQSQTLPDVSFFSENPEFTSLNQTLEALTRTSVEKLKIIEQIRQIQIKTKKERQELVSRELVSKVFAKLYMVDVNELRTLGANLAPEIAAIASIDDNEVMVKVGEVIEKEVFVVLQHIKRIINDFLKELEVRELG